MLLHHLICKEIDKGLGLGLYVTYNLIQAMGGMLECVASNENNSVCFQFNLRLKPCEDAAPHMLPNIGRISQPTSLINTTAVQTWTAMCDTAAAHAHIIEDDATLLPPFKTSRKEMCIDKLLRVLVVDDSPICQRILVRMLNKHGYEVDTADNGLGAIEKLSIEPCLYRACLMDLR